MPNDRSIEEPCEVTSLTHGFEAERGGRPLRLGSALYERLKATGLPVECGSGGLTKFNRSLRNLPKEHWLDAVCVGKNTPEKLGILGVVPLLIAAEGHGRRQMCMMGKRGFPRTSPKAAKYVKGFQTGDLVRAVVKTGTKMGTYVGRVAIRATGSFDITTERGTIEGISHRRCHALHKSDGYSYGYGMHLSSTSFERSTHSSPNSNTGASWADEMNR